jgi:hypothetical protein
MIGDNFWIGGGLYDANANSGGPSLDTWDSGELLKHVELGWMPGFSRRATDRLQLIMDPAVNPEEDTVRPQTRAPGARTHE